MLEKVTFPAMAKDEQLFSLELPGFWMDVGQPKDYLAGSALLLDSYRQHQPELLAPEAKNIKGNVLMVNINIEINKL